LSPFSLPTENEWSIQTHRKSGGFLFIFPRGQAEAQFEWLKINNPAPSLYNNKRFTIKRAEGISAILNLALY
jgi:hypothetical protein